MQDLREFILNHVNDLIADFLYYDRRDDDELGLGTIDQAVVDGTVTVDEIVERFRTELENGLKP